MDGRVDLRRIVDEARRLCDRRPVPARVTAVFAASAAARPAGRWTDVDRFAALALLPGAYRAERYRRRTCSRVGRGHRAEDATPSLPALFRGPVFRASLRWPSDPTVQSIRVALEKRCCSAMWGPRGERHHLEFFGAAAPGAGASLARSCTLEACGHAARLSPHGDPGGSFAPVERPLPRWSAAISTARWMNPAYQRMLDPLPAGVPLFTDAWLALHG